MREYKADLAKLRESAQAAAASEPGGAAARAELGLADDYSQTSAGQRERLLQTTDKLGRTGERITQGRQQLLETEVPSRWVKDRGFCQLAFSRLLGDWGWGQCAPVAYL